VNDNNGNPVTLPNGGATSTPSLTFTPSAAGTWSVALTVTDTTVSLATSTAPQPFTVDPDSPSGDAVTQSPQVTSLAATSTTAAASAPAGHASSTTPGASGSSAAAPVFSSEAITADWLQSGDDVLDSLDNSPLS